MSINSLTSAAHPGLSISQENGFFYWFLLSVKACTLQFKQILACLAKCLVSIAVYNWIAERIEGEKRYGNGMGQNYYISNMITTARKGAKNQNIQ